MKRLSVFLALGMAFAACRAEVPLENRLKSFEIVWQRVHDNFYDPNFGGVDWNKVKADYRPKVEAAKSDEDYWNVLRSMVEELKVSHFGILPPQAYDPTLPNGATERSGGVGIEVRLVEGRPVVTNVEAGSPAAKAGVEPGWVIVSVANQPTSKVVQAIFAMPERNAAKRLYSAMAIDGLLSGKPGTEVAVGFLDMGLKKVEKTLTRVKKPGELQKFGELPAMNARMEAKKLPGNVGYVKFNIFLIPLLQPVKDAIDSFQGSKGLILDIRGNPGGVGAMAIPIAAKFAKKEGSLGTMSLRQGKNNFKVLPQPPTFKGPVVLLIDEGSGSTSEILASGLKEMGLAKLVGSTTAGAVLPSVIEKLPCGARFQFAFADFKTPKGVLLEGRGVSPHVDVVLTRERLNREGDPALREALRILGVKP